MHPDVIDFVGVLPVASRSVHVRPVLQDLHAAAFPACLLSALFLKGKINHTVNPPGALYVPKTESARTPGMVSRTPFEQHFLQREELEQHPGCKINKP